jgi:hypothetical protein
MNPAHYTYALVPRWELGAVKLRAVLDFQAPAVKEAALTAAHELARLGIRFAFAGGLAVGAHGHVRATADVDFLVGDEAFEHHAGGIITFRAGVPINVRGIAIDYLTTANLGPHVEAVLDAPTVSDGLPVIPADVLVYTKLVARRLRDQADVAQLVKAGLDVEAPRRYLQAHAPDLLPLFERILEQAAHE